MSKDNFERKHKLALALEGVLPSLRSSRLETFDYMTFKDDADFETWLAETKEWAAEVTNTKKPKDQESGISQNVQDWIKEKDPSTSLGGKDLNSAFQVSGPTSAAGSLSGKSI